LISTVAYSELFFRFVFPPEEESPTKGVFLGSLTVKGPARDKGGVNQ
jgi:hypothetical protein